jgi:hypothetical protein
MKCACIRRQYDRGQGVSRQAGNNTANASKGNRTFTEREEGQSYLSSTIASYAMKCNVM